MRHPFSGLSFTLHHNLLDFGVGWTNEKLGAVETDATQNFDSLHQESGMVDRLGEIYVSEVTGALGHAAGARLASRGALDNTLPGVHEAAPPRIPGHRSGIPRDPIGVEIPRGSYPEIPRYSPGPLIDDR